MRHYPLFADLNGKTILVSGASDTAVSKLRLLLKTNASVKVFGDAPDDKVIEWSKQGQIELFTRAAVLGDFDNVFLAYCANDNGEEDARIAGMARHSGALVNIVDNLEDSDFITPAIVDRDPVTIAIGTEGQAPVLARKIKSDLETALPSGLGYLARIGNSFRSLLSGIENSGTKRKIWQKFYFENGVRAFQNGGAEAARAEFGKVLKNAIDDVDDGGNVTLVGAGPGDPDLLTIKAQKSIQMADVIIHDRLVSDEILELARREAIVIETGKTGFGPSWKQEAIHALMITHANNGADVVRLKSGDPAIYGRLDEELDALDEAGVKWSIIPGITTASAAASNLGQSLTKRNRNSSLKFLTGHDINGFANHDWHELAKPGSVAAIYMGVKASSFMMSRLLMHGASPQTPITILERVSRHDQKTVSTTLIDLPNALKRDAVKGPAILMLGLAPRDANAISSQIPFEKQAG